MDNCHPHQKLGEMLVQRQLISREQLQSAIALQQQTRQPLGEILVNLQLISERQLIRTLKWQQMLKAAMLISSFTLAGSPCFASEAQRLTHQLVANPANYSQASLNPGTAKRATAHREPSWLTNLRTGPAAPVVTLISGHYAGGVSKFTKGVRYQANWSEDSLKLELRYQF